MITMTVEQLYDKLCSKAFQDPRNGDLHYNYFMFQYDATKEYDMLRQIDDIREKINEARDRIAEQITRNNAAQEVAADVADVAEEAAAPEEAAK